LGESGRDDADARGEHVYPDEQPIGKDSAHTPVPPRERQRHDVADADGTERAPDNQTKGNDTD
jgi:hypothetical protein